MNIRLLFLSLIGAASVFGTEIQSLSHLETYSYSTDVTALIMLKSELESTKKILIEYHKSKSLGLVKGATDSLASLIKELLYGTGAIALGLGTVGVAAGIIYGPTQVMEMFERFYNRNFPPHGSLEKNELVGRLLVAIPTSVVAIILSYILLKLTLGRSTNVDEELNPMVEKALIDIDKVLNKIDYKINLATGVPLAH